MTSVSLADIGKDPAGVVRRVKRSRKPLLLLDGARPAAYLVDAARFEAMQAELRELRHEQLLRDVAEAEAEIARGEVEVFDNVEDLIASWQHDDDQPPADAARP